jgi:hypothetical protein
MERITDIIYGVFAAGVGILSAGCIPFQTKKYFLWEIPVTAADIVGEAYGISSVLTSILMGISFGSIVYLGLCLNRRIR